jgi:LuxR family maltose regulon positive regulatory protein
LANQAHAGLSQVFCEWNQLEAAAQHTHECIALCRQWENYDLLAVGYVMSARLEHVQGNADKAQEAMRAAEQLASEGRLSSKRSIWVKSALARLWMAQGNLDRLSQLVQESGLTLDSITHDAEIPYSREPEYFILLRLLLARGDHDAALALSDRLLQKAEATHRIGQVIETLVLESLAFQGKKDMAQALTVLEKALSLAQPEGYVRVFLDEGEPMAKLLYQAKSRRTGAGYAAELLSAMGSASGAAQPPTQLLIEPLSMRELEVLKLIEAGHSNQEIAAKLVISIPTVKRHISNIYAKLGVESRTQAISRGRELRLV